MISGEEHLQLLCKTAGGGRFGKKLWKTTHQLKNTVSLKFGGYLKSFLYYYVHRAHLGNSSFT